MYGRVMLQGPAGCRRVAWLCCISRRGVGMAHTYVVLRVAVCKLQRQVLEGDVAGAAL